MTLACLASAERLLISLGVTEPAEIDLEAIALTMGAKVKYRPLDGCAARITGTMDKAVITIDEGAGARRKRFSVAHEIGHWRHHRGRTFECKASDIGSSREYNAHDPERVADRFAADLLMPLYLFRPVAAKAAKMTLDIAQQLGDLFDVSLTAAAIRLVEVGPAPAMLVCRGAEGRRWFRRGKDVPEHFYPRRDLDPESFAADVLAGRIDRSRPSKVMADAWLDVRGADRYEIVEQSFRARDGGVLTMLWWQDEAQIEAAFAERRCTLKWRT